MVDKSEVTVCEIVPPTLSVIDDDSMEGFYPNPFSCSCLSSMSSVSSVVRVSL